MFTRPFINLGYGNDRPDGINSLAELIEFSALHNAERVFGLQSKTGDAEPVPITFAQLRKMVEAASSWLVENGVTKERGGEEVAPVGLLLGSDMGLFVYMAALLRIGTPVLSLSARLTPVAIAHLMRATGARTILVGPQTERAAKEAEGLLNDTTSSFVHPPGYADLLQLRPAWIPSRYSTFEYGDRDALIMHSSGTTGLPKPIYHAQGYIMLYATNHDLKEEEFGYNVSTLPLYHGFGLLAPCLSLSIGMPFIIPPASVIPTARTTLDTLRAHNARTMFSVPSILEDILRLGQVGVDTLKTLDFIAIGGAPMKESVAEELTNEGVRLLNHWGATELGAIATVQYPPKGYDWHYIIARSDINLRFDPAGDGTFRLSGRAPGWDEPFVVQDYLLVNPSDPWQYRIMGRADDLMVLATGEKVRPAGMVLALSECPHVKDVLAFGEGRESMGVIVELIGGESEVDETFWEYLEKGNAVTDKHGKVTREMVIFTWEDNKPFVRTDKGSLQRKANLELFEAEINEVYVANGETGEGQPFDGDLLVTLRNMVFDVSQAKEYLDEKADGMDFFEAGMDSLQATRLRRAILAGLRATPNLPRPIEDAHLEPDFCFQYPSVNRLVRAVGRLLRGEFDVAPEDVVEDARLEAMEAMVDKYRIELFAFSKTAREAKARKRNAPSQREGKVVLLTGSTGSLGCFLLKRLLIDEAVDRVICVNRARGSGSEPLARQAALMRKRGAVVEPDAWERVSFLDIELSAAKWTDPELLQVTHIIHNAWPVNFNRHLASFESHIAGLVSLLRLSILSSANSPHPTRLLFASSVAVVGRYPILHPDGPFEVPETPLDAVYTAEFGYPEAKWVCERIVQIADHLYGYGGFKLIKGSSVRIGQMTGAEGVGAWNETEHFPIIIQASQMLGALPSVEGSLSWMPVNRAGNAIVEMAFSKRFCPMYHMENPSRQSWSGILGNFAHLLSLPFIPYVEWLDKVRALGDRTPAYKVMLFLENDFMRMAAGKVILGTAETKKDSKEMVTSTSLDRKHLEEYLQYWAKLG